MKITNSCRMIYHISIKKDRDTDVIRYNEVVSKSINISSWTNVERCKKSVKKNNVNGTNGTFTR